MDRLTELEVFKRVARLGSFTRAAESLGISRATVTRTIRLLESRLGVTLLSRTTRVVTLSAAGSVFCSKPRSSLPGATRSTITSRRPPKS